MNIYVGNLPYEVSEEELRQAFGNYGEVVRVNLVTDRLTGKPRGFGFVEMGSDDEGAAAIQGLDGKENDGRALKVNEARPRESRGGGGGRGRW